MLFFGIKWFVVILFDVGVFYKWGILIFFVFNGKDYLIWGIFIDVGIGLGVINIIIGNNIKIDVISKV